MAKKVAWIFPGQGAQYVGMGKDLYDVYPAAKDMFHQANDILGFDIAQLCFEGPEEELKKTNNSQPAIFLVSMICAELLKEKGVSLPAVFMAGLSLGEYTALAAGGVFSFAQGLMLVRQRGQYMEEAAQKNPGQMLSVIGIDRATAGLIAQESGAETANFNCPGQIVFSGTVRSIEKAKVLAEQKGSKRAVLLEVSGPFHSSLMQPAIEQLQNALAQVSFSHPSCSIISNVTAQPQEDPSLIKANLLHQLTSPTRWEDSMQYLAQQGVNLMVEIGPGKVLKGLQKRINPEISVVNIGTREELQQSQTEAF